MRAPFFMAAGQPDAIEPLISGLTLDERIAWGMSAAGDSLEVNIQPRSDEKSSSSLQVSVFRAAYSICT